MRAAWAAEGIADRSVILDGLLPGLYTVRVDDQGERRFSYWRSASAARHLFAGTEWVEHLDARRDPPVRASRCSSRPRPPARRSRHRLAALRAAGTLISLDTNYRASGWPSRAEAARAMDEVAAVATVVFATFDDEAAMHRCRSVAAAADRLAGLGVPEVVVKSGADGARVVAGTDRAHPGIAGRARRRHHRRRRRVRRRLSRRTTRRPVTCRGGPDGGGCRGSRGVPSGCDHPAHNPADPVPSFSLTRVALHMASSLRGIAQ